MLEIQNFGIFLLACIALNITPGQEPLIRCHRKPSVRVCSQIHDFRSFSLIRYSPPIFSARISPILQIKKAT